MPWAAAGSETHFRSLIERATRRQASANFGFTSKNTFIDSFPSSPFLLSEADENASCLRSFCEGQEQGNRKNSWARDFFCFITGLVAGDARLLPIVVEETQIGQQDAEEDLVNRECP